jgi:hypothetical protein
MTKGAMYGWMCAYMREWNWFHESEVGFMQQNFHINIENAKNVSV